MVEKRQMGAYRRKLSVLWLAGTCLAVAIILVLVARPARSAVPVPNDSPFPQPEALQPAVRFWKEVFTKYSCRDFIVVDSTDVRKTYEILHLQGFGPPSSGQIANANVYLKDKYSRILYWLAEGGQPRDPDERRVAAYFPHGSRPIYLKAASSLRVQEGVRERFLRGMVRSIQYRAMMRRIFQREGLPPGLVALAAIESGFDPGAHSSAGAAGIWQFMQGTARRYLRISRYRDDRMNPYLATVAAARLLRSNYELLGNWPLAITAYNYGAGGMAHAAAEYNADYVQVLVHYEGPRFGFAARNYYPEFLAADEIYQHSDQYFPGLDQISTPLLLADERPAPPVARVSARASRAHHVTYYTIRHGDTLSHIANVYGVSVESLLSENNLRSPRSLRAGHVLAIPAVAVHSPTQTTHRYRVARGDTLYGIARRARVSLRRLMEVNRIYRPRALSIGMILHIPGV